MANVERRDDGPWGERLARLEGKVEMLTRMVMGQAGGADRPEAGDPYELERVAGRLTRKQHAVLQMVVRGADNWEISERLQVGESTAKGFVHSIMTHMRRETGRQVFSRVQVAEFGERLLAAVSDEEYEAKTRFPKTWDADWTKADRDVHRDLYVKRDR